MASALMILFLGCWLAGQSGVSGDAGSIPTGGTNLTQPGMMPAPTRPGSAGPSNKSGSRKSPSTTPQTGGTDLTQPGTTPAPTHPGSAKPDAGSIPTRGTNPTQPGTVPAPTRPGSAGPSTGAGARKSPSTPPETGLCCPRNCFWGEPRRAGCVGRGQIPTANAPSGLRPHQTHFICKPSQDELYPDIWW
ncbi:cuticle collagen 34-like isoform X2 [Mauremys reevesii]|uniref:cuticle collagen 34-like isoform X2 n=1 Tax=Mauremys reevesii TaxID=260615 RepID=UPI00193FBC20|nr:cuticle collagen 34-like isoform X2 [Mauremys reevesii]